MIAPDANLLIYAISPTSPFHSASRKWLESLLSGSEPVGLPLWSIYGLIGFMTNPAVHPRPAIFQQTAATVDSWLALPHVRMLYPGDRHWELVNQLAAKTTIRAAKLTDAAIAAIAIEYGAVVHTNDSDFARFPGVRCHYPLQP